MDHCYDNCDNRNVGGQTDMLGGLKNVCACPSCKIETSEQMSIDGLRAALKSSTGKLIIKHVDVRRAM